MWLTPDIYAAKLRRVLKFNPKKAQEIFHLFDEQPIIYTILLSPVCKTDIRISSVTLPLRPLC